MRTISIKTRCFQTTSKHKYTKDTQIHKELTNSQRTHKYTKDTQIHKGHTNTQSTETDGRTERDD